MNPPRPSAHLTLLLLATALLGACGPSSELDLTAPDDEVVVPLGDGEWAWDEQGLEKPSVQSGENAKVATYNCPQRYPTAGRREDLRRLAERGVTLLGTQEFGDDDAAQLAPNGWGHWRPAVERSSAVLWDQSTWKVLERGYFKVSSPGDPVAPRYVVWVYLEHRTTKRHVRLGSVHLPAFKTSIAKNAREFRHQEDRAAEWLSRGPARVLVGDFNAQPDSSWMSTVDKVGVHHAPVVPTGPHRTEIDHVWRPRGEERPKTVGTMDGVSDHQALIVTL